MLLKLRYTSMYCLEAIQIKLITEYFASKHAKEHVILNIDINKNIDKH